MLVLCLHSSVAEDNRCSGMLWYWLWRTYFLTSWLWCWRH